MSRNLLQNALEKVKKLVYNTFAKHLNVYKKGYWAFNQVVIHDNALQNPGKRCKRILRAMTVIMLTLSSTITTLNKYVFNSSPS